MEKNIKFRGYLTFDDSLKVQQALKPRRLVSPAAIVSVLTVGAVGLALWQMNVGKPMAIFMLVFLATFMGGGFRLMNTSARKSQERLYAKACIKRHGTFKADGIQIKRGPTKTHIPWESFEKALHVDDIVALVKNKDALGFAEYMFSSEHEWTQARERLHNRYP